MLNSSNHAQSEYYSDTPMFIAYSLLTMKAFVIRLTSEAKIKLDPDGTSVEKTGFILQSKDYF